VKALIKVAFEHAELMLDIGLVTAEMSWKNSGGWRS